MLSAITLEELKRQLATQVFVKFDKRQSMRFIPEYQARAAHIAANGIAVDYRVIQEKENLFIVIAGERYRMMEVELDKVGLIRMFVYEAKGECSMFERVYRKFT